MIKHTCAHCSSEKHSPELNDDPRINPKVTVGQVIHLKDEQFQDVAFRVVKMDHLTFTLEKLLGGV